MRSHRFTSIWTCLSHHCTSTSSHTRNTVPPPPPPPAPAAPSTTTTAFSSSTTSFSKPQAVTTAAAAANTTAPAFDPAARVQQLRESLRMTVYTWVSRGLFEGHKLIFLAQVRGGRYLF